jgi:hypothetical protein
MSCTDKECCYHGQPRVSGCECGNSAAPKKKADIPAFPCEWDYIGSNREAANGMLLRDYFAAKAMPVVLHNCDSFPDENWRMGVALDAYAMADAMLKAREQS